MENIKLKNTIMKKQPLKTHTQKKNTKPSVDCFNSRIERAEKRIEWILRGLHRVTMPLPKGHMLYNFICVVKVCEPLSHVQLCDPMDSSPPGSFVHRILQAWILDWVSIPFSRGSSRPRDQTWLSCIAGGFFTIRDFREALHLCNSLQMTKL